MNENQKILEFSADDKNQSCSKFKYAKIAKQTACSVVLEWMYDNSEDEKIDFKIVTLKNRDEWITLCWSQKTSCTIKNLEENTCYSIKILAMMSKKDKFEIVDSSEILKVN